LCSSVDITIHQAALIGLEKNNIKVTEGGVTYVKIQEKTSEMVANL
jgi:hypothetical protein